MWHDSFIHSANYCVLVTPTHCLRDMTHSYLMPLIRTWRQLLCSLHSDKLVVWCDSLMCDVNHSCLMSLIHTSHNSFIHNITYSYVASALVSFSLLQTGGVTWLTHVWRHSFIYATTHSYITSLIRIWRQLWCSLHSDKLAVWRDSLMFDVTHSYIPQLMHT